MNFEKVEQAQAARSGQVMRLDVDLFTNQHGYLMRKCKFDSVLSAYGFLSHLAPFPECQLAGQLVIPRLVPFHV